MRAVLDGDLRGRPRWVTSQRLIIDGLNGVNLLTRMGKLRPERRPARPPPIFYVDDRSLTEVVAEHEQFCDSAGAKGQVLKMSEIDFRPMKTLKRRRLSGLNAPRSVFFGMDLEGCQFQGADLTDCDFRGANLREADLRGAKFTDAQLARADLRGAKMGRWPGETAVPLYRASARRRRRRAPCAPGSWKFK